MESLNSTEINSRLQSALEAVQSQNPSAALNHLGPLLSLRPMPQNAQFLKGLCHVLLGDVVQACDEMRQELANYPHNEHVRPTLDALISDYTRSRQFSREAEVLRGFTKSGDVLVDIGSNVGDFSEVFLLHGVDVVSVEPSTQHCLHQRNRFSRLVAEGRFVICECACSEVVGEATLFLSDDETGGLSSLQPEWREIFEGNFNSARTSRVRTLPLPQLLNQLPEKYRRPKIVKIDTEGHELAVLKGIFGNGSTLRPDFLMFEYHTLPEIKARLQQELELLHNHGYRSFKFFICHGEHLLLETPWLSDEGALKFDVSCRDGAQLAEGGVQIPAGIRYGNVIVSREERR